MSNKELDDMFRQAYGQSCTPANEIPQNRRKDFQKRQVTSEKYSEFLRKYADLEKYIDYEFSSGCYTGDDYKSFQTKYINFLRSICKQNHWQLVNVGRNHYCFSAFIKSAENKCVYVSISDVRFFTNEWYNNILIRTAKNEQDYHGGFNHRTTLKELEMKAMELLEDFPF